MPVGFPSDVHPEYDCDESHERRQQRQFQLTVTAWRCGGIQCFVIRQLKPIKNIKFKLLLLVYNFKPEQTMIRELKLVLRFAGCHNAKPMLAEV